MSKGRETVSEHAVDFFEIHLVADMVCWPCSQDADAATGHRKNVGDIFSIWHSKVG
jgi:hypothetical protein